MEHQTPSCDEAPVLRLTRTGLGDLIDELLWPGLLRAPALALGPGRIGLGAVTLLVLLLVGQTSRLWREGEDFATLIGRELGERAGTLLGAIGTLDVEGIVRGGTGLITDLPGEVWRADPVGVLVVLPLMLLAWAVGGGAIARSCACEFAQRVSIGWPRSLAFSLARWAALAMAIMVPIVFIVSLVLGIAVAGLVLLGIPVVSVVGALFYPALLACALVAGVTLFGFVLGNWMLLPAVACEGTDAIDAIQRVYHYVLHQFLRLVLYLALLVVLGALALGVAAVLLHASDAIVVHALAWVLPAERVTGEGIQTDLIATWRKLPALLLSAYALSLVHCSGTVLYLLIRAANDGQEVGEVWMPGLVEGTQAAGATIADEQARGG